MRTHDFFWHDDQPISADGQFVSINGPDRESDSMFGPTDNAAQDMIDFMDELSSNGSTELITPSNQQQSLNNGGSTRLLYTEPVTSRLPSEAPLANYSLRELILSFSFIESLTADSEITYSHLLFMSRRRLERRIEALYGLNTLDALFTIEAMRALLGLVEESLRELIPTSREENRYIARSFSVGLKSAIRVLLFIEKLQEKLHLSNVDQMKFEVLNESVNETKETLNRAIARLSGQLFLDDSANSAAYWFEDPSPAARARPVAMPMPSRSTNNHWEIITRDGAAGIGLRFNGQNIPYVSKLEFDAESGGVMRLSVEVLVVPGQSTLSFSRQLSDTINDTEGNALSVEDKAVGNRFIDL